jgi:hypothetical protein
VFLLLCLQGDEKNDNWIFSLAVLLSSTLVYNSMGTIDNNALEKLQYPSAAIKKYSVVSYVWVNFIPNNRTDLKKH